MKFWTMILILSSATSLCFGLIKPSSQNRLDLDLKREEFESVFPIKIESVDLADQLILNLKIDKGLNLTAMRKKFFKKDDKEFWTGRVIGDSLSRVIVVKSSKGDYSINLDTGAKNYWSLKKANRYYLVESKQRHEGDDVIIRNEIDLDEKTSKAVITSPSSDKFIDLMVVYTPNALAQDSAIETTIASRISAINSYLEDSCANFRFRLVHTQQVTYTESSSGGIQTDLSTLYSGASFATGTLSGVSAIKETYGADLVQMITNNTSESTYCGIAYTNTVDAFNDVRSVSVSQLLCGPVTMAHELGHNLGLQHDPYQFEVDTSGSNSFNYGDGYGFVDLANNKRSIMSYSTHCTNEGVTCERLSLFSNPKKTINGVPFGIGGVADAVGQLNKNFSYVANFRQSVTSYSPAIDYNCVASSDEKDIHCFIATAAMGSYMHDDVVSLREFRDRFLKGNVIGEQLINFYYKYSPYLAKKIRDSKRLRSLAQQLVKVLAWSTQNGETIIISLLMVVCCLFMSKQVFFIFLFIFTLQSDRLEANTALPSLFPNSIGDNPATRFKLNYPYLFGLTQDQITSKEGSGGVSNKVARSRMSLIIGTFSPHFFGELSYLVQDKDSRTQSTDGISDTERDVESGGYVLQLGSSLPLVGNIGLRYQSLEVKDSEDFYTKNRALLGLGKVFEGATGMSYAIGLDLISEKGDAIADVKWLEVYLGLAVGTSNGLAGNFFEYSLRRRPKVLTTDETNVSFYPEKLGHRFLFESSNYRFFVISKLRLSLEFNKESELEPFQDSDISTNEYGFGFGGKIALIGSEYLLNYALAVRDDEFAREETKISIALLWGGGSSP